MERKKIIEIIEQSDEFEECLSDLYCDEGVGPSRKFLIEEVISQYLALKGLDEKPPAHVCAHCGVEFDRTNGPQKYCSDDCAKDAKRKNDAEYRVKNREKRNNYNRKYREQKKADFETYLNGSTPPKDMGGE